MPRGLSRSIADSVEGPAEGRVEDWFTVTQAARRLGVSERAVRKKVERGNLEGRRVVEGNVARLMVRLFVEERAERPAEGHVEDHAEELVRTLREEVQNLRGELARERNHVEELRARTEDLHAHVEDLRTERDAARIEAAELRGRLAEATRPGPLGRLFDALAARLSAKRSVD